MIRSKAKVTDGQGHRNSHKMAIDHWSWPTLCFNKMLIKLDEPSPVFLPFYFTKHVHDQILQKLRSVDDSLSQNLGKSKMVAILLNVLYVKNH